MPGYARRRGSLRWYAAWLMVGAALAFGLLAILSIGIFILPVALVATALLARNPEARRGIGGLVSGLGTPLLYVAFLNREGPGTICTTTTRSQSCVDEYSPWPWLAIGVVLMAIGLTAFLRQQAARQRSTT